MKAVVLAVASRRSASDSTVPMVSIDIDPPNLVSMRVTRRPAYLRTHVRHHMAPTGKTADVVHTPARCSCATYRAPESDTSVLNRRPTTSSSFARPTLLPSLPFLRAQPRHSGHGRVSDSA